MTYSEREVKGVGSELTALLTFRLKPTRLTEAHSKVLRTT